MLHQGHRKRVASITRGARPWFVVDHYPHVGDPQAGCRGRTTGLSHPNWQPACVNDAHSSTRGNGEQLELVLGILLARCASRRVTAQSP